MAAIGIPVTALALSVATSVVSATPALAAPTATATDTPAVSDGDTLNNTGVLDNGSQETYVPPDAALPQIQAKEALVGNYTAALNAGTVNFAANGVSASAAAGTVTPQACGPDPECNTPSRFYLPGLVDHREGEGNGKKHWTCGPAATRNMVQTMTGADYGEHQFELWEGTTTDGTDINAIASTLNNHFSSWGGWKVSRPTSSLNLLSYVITDTLTYRQGIIPNVSTGSLSFFKGHDLRHFDMIYGWGSSGDHLGVNEEWDPVYIYGNADYQPYGQHDESRVYVFNAVYYSPTHSIVA